VFRQVPNQPLQQTAASMLISHSSLLLSAAAAAERGCSAAPDISNGNAEKWQQDEGKHSH
jgi:hypothetical protein